MAWGTTDIKPENFKVQYQSKYDKMKKQLADKDEDINKLLEQIEELKREIKNLKISNTLLKKNSEK